MCENCIQGGIILAHDVSNKCVNIEGRFEMRKHVLNPQMTQFLAKEREWVNRGFNACLNFYILFLEF